MIEDKLTQEELDNDCPLLMDALDEFLNTELDASPEATVYVLAQILHERIKALTFPAEEKGGIISTVINGFVEFNGPELAAYRELRQMLLEQKGSTTH